MPSLDFTGPPPKKYTEVELQAAVAKARAAERERIRRGAGRMPGEDWYDVPAHLLEGDTDA